MADARLCDVSLDGACAGRDKRIEREQALAIMDLLECNSFVPVGHDGGPYGLRIALADGRLALHIADDRGTHVASHYLALGPFRRLVRDYTRVCESYYDTMVRPGAERLEAIDMGRRAIHNDAAELLRERLSTRVRVDSETARRLFTLVYALLSRRATPTQSA